jgi:IMP dehydrogenase
METHRPSNSDWDSAYYLGADAFFGAQRGTALTYDDVSLATNYSEVLPRHARLETRLSERVTLSLPVVSADMDTVTESDMAIGLALNGGIGLIHYNLSERHQVKEVARVKNHVHGLIREPITFHPDQSIGEVLAMIEARRFNFSTFPIVDASGKLVGLLPGAVVKTRYASRLVSEAMTPRPSVQTLMEEVLGENPVVTADKFFAEHMGLHKLLVVDREDRLCGLFTLSDIERITAENSSSRRPSRDSKFRLLCGAAIAAPRLSDGALDRDRLLSHVGQLVAEGLDVAAVSTAHGHTVGVGEIVRLLRSEFPELTLIAGNVTSGEGVRFLSEAGAHAIKVGQGPGSICTTRIVAGVGVPQLTALYVCSRAASECGAAIIADGGITKSGDAVKALTLANAIMCGGMLAGCREAPGSIIEINGKHYKQYRGMGSLEAMKAGSAARYGHDGKDVQRKAAAEGIEALKEVSDTVDHVLTQLAGGLQAGMGYLGARDLTELRARARYVRVTPAGQREAAPHDVIEVKTQTA